MVNISYFCAYTYFWGCFQLVILIILAIAFILWFIIKPYIIKHDTVTLYVGGLGSGKTLIGVKDALHCLRRNRVKVFWHNLFHPKDKKPKPMLYSTIPVRISSREISLDLDADHLMLQKSIIEKSVLFIDEASTVANSFENVSNNKNLKSLEEFSTFFRHFTRGGYLILTTQNTAKCNYVVRYCTNQAFQLSQFRNILNIVYWVKCRNLDLTNDVVNVSESNLEDSTRNLIGFFGRRAYNTYAFHPRYKSVPKGAERFSNDDLTRRTFAQIPREYVEPKTNK